MRLAHKVKQKKKKNLRGVRRCRYGERQRFLGSFGLESALPLYVVMILKSVKQNRLCSVK